MGFNMAVMPDFQKLETQSLIWSPCGNPKCPRFEVISDMIAGIFEQSRGGI
jgi:hypothetical protein